MNRTCFTPFAQALLPAVLFIVSFGMAQAQTCNPSIPLSMPDSDFVDNGDGTVTHNKTGLMWSQCLLGQSGSDCSNGSAIGYNWQQALEAADASTLAGYSDWRLPTVKELDSIVEEACYDPAINLNVFPNALALTVWSSTPNVNTPYWAWGLYFNTGVGGKGAKSNEFNVRLVRGGQLLK